MMKGTNIAKMGFESIELKVMNSIHYHSIGICIRSCSRITSLSLLTESLVVGGTLAISPPFLSKEKAG